ncbi:response regulator transcription factor [Halalkalibacter akibai]|uniref:Two-component response regulator n=1 Tax=Halalkalibacter akibai (strain ATCC 43226 / DSM 21942 / CIP 109018 / JCM 9157 / 1139) TaxID=1236973 RepID=W4QU02_HALA3|nr:response regulator transcription factor [Halalkalibacter akibai]GAE35551.1 two-component response regulator [Halalkalibacter akibai JCM 9157]
MKKILIVDDEKQMQSLLCVCIGSSEFELTTAGSGKEALELIKEQQFDLMLLDIMMPEMNGFQVLKELTEKELLVPTIIISAIGETDQVVEGLNLGASDYITKPFEPKELVARVNSVLRRVEPFQQVEKRKGMFGITIDHSQQMVFYNQKGIPLTKKEYQLFSTLLSNPGRVYTREQLFYLVWDEADDRDFRNIDTHIKNIRDKLKKAGLDNTVVETVWGIGYKVPQHEGLST